MCNAMVACLFSCGLYGKKYDGVRSVEVLERLVVEVAYLFFSASEPLLKASGCD